MEREQNRDCSRLITSGNAYYAGYLFVSPGISCHTYKCERELGLHALSISWKNASSVFLFILLFHVHSHFFSSLCGAFYLVYSRLSIHLSLFQLLLPFKHHSSFGHQSIVMGINSSLFTILQRILQQMVPKNCSNFRYCHAIYWEKNRHCSNTERQLCCTKIYLKTFGSEPIKFWSPTIKSWILICCP